MTEHPAFVVLHIAVINALLAERSTTVRLPASYRRKWSIGGSNRLNGLPVLGFDVVAESDDEIRIGRFLAGDWDGVVPEVVLQIKPPPAAKFDSDALICIEAGGGAMADVFEAVLLVKENNVITPESEFVPDRPRS